MSNQQRFNKISLELGLCQDFLDHLIKVRLLDLKHKDKPLPLENIKDAIIFIEHKIGILLTVKEMSDILDLYPQVKISLLNNDLRNEETEKQVTDMIAQFFLARAWPSSTAAMNINDSFKKSLINSDNPINMNDFIELIREQARRMNYQVKPSFFKC